MFSKKNYSRCVIFVWYFVCFVPQNSFQSPHERKLYSDLLEKYTVLERPVENDSDPILLKFGVTLLQILNVDVQNQQLVTSTWLNLEWNDVNLRWNSSEYGNITDLRFPQHKIWSPDVLMYNSADEGFDGSYRGTNVVVKHDGNCSYIPPGIFKSTCKFDMTWFPFDEQVCNLKFGSWTYDGLALDFELQDEEGGGDLSSLVSNAEWEVEKFPGQKNTIMYACCPEPFVDVTFTLHLRRRSSHFHYNIILPSAFVAACGLLVFVLPPDSRSKLIFGIATFALLNCFTSSLSSYRTHTSSPLIAQYLSGLMILVLLSIVSSVFVLNLHYRTSKMPRLIRRWFLECLPQFLMMRKYRRGIIHKSPSDAFLNEELNHVGDTANNFGSAGSQENGLSLILTELQKLTEKLHKDELAAAIKNDWKFAAEVLDRICLIVFATIFILTTIIAWASHL